MINIRKVKSVDELYDHINQIHEVSSAYVTNFYAGKDSLQSWIEWKEADYLLTEKALFLLRNSKFSTQVYYFSDGNEEVLTGLKQLTEERDSLNVDYLGHGDDMKEVYEAAGFKYYIALSRMTRFCKEGEDGRLEYGEYAKSDDAEEICDILEKSMDIMADQVPSVYEIKEYINQSRAIILRNKDNNDIISCILWTRLGKGMEWKYWALNPNYKGTIYSINLLDDYLRINGAVKRATLFVRDGNPASTMYQKIGFKYDGLKDYVYCFRRDR